MIQRILIGLVLLLGIGFGFQSIRANYLADRNVALQADIKNIRAAQALTDQLRKANANLNRDQDNISEDLRDATGYSDPLSPDVVRVLDRLRNDSAAP